VASRSEAWTATAPAAQRGANGTDRKSKDWNAGVSISCPADRGNVSRRRARSLYDQVSCYDAPLTALDAALRDRLRVELDRLLRTLGITTIYVTHDQVEAMSLADRVV
jgi:ABC-type taurine transport system ATPase subunit